MVKDKQEEITIESVLSIGDKNEKNTALHFACKKKQFHKIKRLLKNKANIDAFNF